MKGANLERELVRCEILLKREISPRYDPPIEKAFGIIEERLIIVKKIYAKAMATGRALRDSSPPDEERQKWLLSLEGARNGYIGVDRAIEILKGVRASLRLAPTNFKNFNEKKGGEARQAD